MGSQEIFEHRILFEFLQFILENQKLILDQLPIEYNEEKMDYLLTQAEAVVDHDLWKEFMARTEDMEHDKSKA
jgi:hypothetical protein